MERLQDAHRIPRQSRDIVSVGSCRRRAWLLCGDRPRTAAASCAEARLRRHAPGAGKQVGVFGLLYRGSSSLHKSGYPETER